MYLNRYQNEYVRNGHSPLRESPVGRSTNTEARDRRERYHESRLQTEIALLKFNTPFEKRQHSPTQEHLTNKNNTTVAETNYRQSTPSNCGGVPRSQVVSSMKEQRRSCCDCECPCHPRKADGEHQRDSSPLQDRAYRGQSPNLNTPGQDCRCNTGCQMAHRGHCHDTTSITRPNSLLIGSTNPAIPAAQSAIMPPNSSSYHQRRSSADNFMQDRDHQQLQYVYNIVNMLALTAMIVNHWDEDTTMMSMKKVRQSLHLKAISALSQTIQHLTNRCNELERRCNDLQTNQFMMERMTAAGAGSGFVTDIDNPFRERESRIAMLEAMEMEDRRRFAQAGVSSREREMPLRRSNSRGDPAGNQGGAAFSRDQNHAGGHIEDLNPRYKDHRLDVFQTQEEQENHLRRLRVLADTAPPDTYRQGDEVDSEEGNSDQDRNHQGRDHNPDDGKWLNKGNNSSGRGGKNSHGDSHRYQLGAGQQKQGGSGFDRRSNSNSDQIGQAKGATTAAQYNQGADEANKRQNLDGHGAAASNQNPGASLRSSVGTGGHGRHTHGVPGGEDSLGYSESEQLHFSGGVGNRGGDHNSRKQAYGASNGYKKQHTFGMPGAIAEYDESGQQIKQLISEEMVQAEERNAAGQGENGINDNGEDSDQAEDDVQWQGNGDDGEPGESHRNKGGRGGELDRQSSHQSHYHEFQNQPGSMVDSAPQAQRRSNGRLVASASGSQLQMRNDKGEKRNLAAANRHPSTGQLMPGHMIETVSLDPAEEKKRLKLKKHLREQIVKKPVGARDPYSNKNKEKGEFLKKIQKDLKGLAGDPKKIKQMQKLSQRQLELLKNEQLRQLYDEREVLRRQADEIKRLEWLHNNVNNSYGLKNRHEPVQERRSRSKTKHGAFANPDQHEAWTNTFARSTIHWDEKNGLLEQEKKYVDSVKKLEKFPMRCCGNSPGKQHTTNCDMDRPGSGGWDHSPIRSDNKRANNTGKPPKRLSVQLKGEKSTKQNRARIYKSSTKKPTRSNSAVKGHHRPMTEVKGMAGRSRVSNSKKNLIHQIQRNPNMVNSTEGTQVLYNIDSNGQAINELGSTPQNAAYTKAEKKNLLNDQDDGPKVAAIAKKIRQLTQNTKDAKERDRILQQFTVKFNNQLMTLKEFLAVCGQAPLPPRQKRQNFVKDGDEDLGPAFADEQDAQYAVM